jgi:hypothetical protein
MTCTFCLPKLNDCSCPYCYYETVPEVQCPIKKTVMKRTGPIDPGLARKTTMDQKGKL